MKLRRLIVNRNVGHDGQVFSKEKVAAGDGTLLLRHHEDLFPGKKA